jgi:hypothetical protein
LDEDTAERERLRKRWIDDELRRRLIFYRQERRGTTDVLGALRGALASNEAANGKGGEAKKKRVRDESRGSASK